MVMLASNLESLSEFMADPQAASSKAGLSADDQAILFSGSQSAIFEKIVAEGPGKPAAKPDLRPRS
jgi:hypothetical protein